MEKNTSSARDQNKNVPHKDRIIESADLLVQHTCLTAQMHCISVPFSRTSGYKNKCCWNHTYIYKRCISCWGRQNTEKISPQYQQSSNQCSTVSQVYSREQRKAHFKRAKVLLHNVCYHNLHYSINGDLGGLLIKMSAQRKPNLAVTSLNLN